MPELDDQIEDMDPSAVSDDAAEQQDLETGVAEAAPADPSTATGDTEDTDLLSVVRDVVDASRKPEDQAASQAETEEEGQAAGEQSEEDDDYSDVPFVKHPRFRKLLAERRDFKTRAETAEQDAGRYRNVQSFMDQNGLVAEEAADLLVIGGLMKTNPAEAWKRMKPTVQKLLVAAGEVLDPELAARVQRGEINQAAALEISRSRATTQSMQASQSFQEQRRQREAQQSAGQAIVQAASEWEMDRQAKDPNFADKLPLIEREVAYLQRSEGVPRDPAGVKAQLAKAYGNVNKSFRAPAPAAPKTPTTPRAQKPAITPVRGGAVAGNAQPEAVSTLDIVRQYTRA